MPAFLLAADLLLHPAYHENTGTILLEALVSGLPILTTDVCGYAHYVQEAKAGCVLTSPFQQTNGIVHLKLCYYHPIEQSGSNKALPMPKQQIFIVYQK